MKYKESTRRNWRNGGGWETTPFPVRLPPPPSLNPPFLKIAGAGLPLLRSVQLMPPPSPPPPLLRPETYTHTDDNRLPPPPPCLSWDRPPPSSSSSYPFPSSSPYELLWPSHTYCRGEGGRLGGQRRRRSFPLCFANLPAAYFANLGKEEEESTFFFSLPPPPSVQRTSFSSLAHTETERAADRLSSSDCDIACQETKVAFV